MIERKEREMEEYIKEYESLHDCLRCIIRQLDDIISIMK